MHVQLVHKHTLDFKDKYITEFTKILKNRTSKSYMKSQRIIYTKTIKKCTQILQRQEITFNVHFELSSDLSHFTLHHHQRGKKSHTFLLNAKTSIFLYREQTHITILKIFARIILSQNFSIVNLPLTQITFRNTAI